MAPSPRRRSIKSTAVTAASSVSVRVSPRVTRSKENPDRDAVTKSKPQGSSKSPKPKNRRSTPGQKSKRQKLDVTETGSEDEELHETTKPVHLRKCPLPCRDTQFGDILAFLESNLELRCSG